MSPIIHAIIIAFCIVYYINWHLSSIVIPMEWWCFALVRSIPTTNGVDSGTVVTVCNCNETKTKARKREKESERAMKLSKLRLIKCIYRPNEPKMSCNFLTHRSCLVTIFKVNTRHNHINQATIWHLWSYLNTQQRALTNTHNPIKRREMEICKLQLKSHEENPIAIEMWNFKFKNHKRFDFVGNVIRIRNWCKPALNCGTCSKLIQKQIP